MGVQLALLLMPSIIIATYLTPRRSAPPAGMSSSSLVMQTTQTSTKLQTPPTQGVIIRSKHPKPPRHVVTDRSSDTSDPDVADDSLPSLSSSLSTSLSPSPSPSPFLDGIATHKGAMVGDLATGATAVAITAVAAAARSLQDDGDGESYSAEADVNLAMSAMTTVAGVAAAANFAVAMAKAAATVAAVVAIGPTVKLAGLASAIVALDTTHLNATHLNATVESEGVHLSEDQRVATMGKAQTPAAALPAQAVQGRPAVTGCAVSSRASSEQSTMRKELAALQARIDAAQRDIEEAEAACVTVAGWDGKRAMVDMPQDAELHGCLVDLVAISGIGKLTVELADGTLRDLAAERLRPVVL